MIINCKFSTRLLKVTKLKKWTIVLTLWKAMINPFKRTPLTLVDKLIQFQNHQRVNMSRNKVPKFNQLINQDFLVRVTILLVLKFKILTREVEGTEIQTKMRMRGKQPARKLWVFSRIKIQQLLIM